MTRATRRGRTPGRSWLLPLACALAILLPVAAAVPSLEVLPQTRVGVETSHQVIHALGELELTRDPQQGYSVPRYDLASGSLLATREGSGGAKGLVHLTSKEAAGKIHASGRLVGEKGIFAVTEDVARRSTLGKMLRTNLSRRNVQEAVQIPESAVRHFRRPLVLGPYSLLLRLQGVRFASAGHINLATGNLVEELTLFGPRFRMHAIDALAWLTIAGYASRDE